MDGCAFQLTSMRTGASCCSNWGWTRSRRWLRVHWAAGLEGGPPGNEMGRGLGTPPSRPSNQGRPGGTRGGSASPHWLAVNKRGPLHVNTPAWRAGREVAAVRPSLANPGARRPHSNLTRPHWTPGPLRRAPCHQAPPVVQQPEAGPRQPNGARPPAPIFEAVLARPADRPRSDLLPPPSLPRNRTANSNSRHLAFEESIEIRA